MRVRNARLVIPFVLSFIGCFAAQAQTSPSTTQFTIGAKVWRASWLSYLPATYTGIGPGGAPAVGDSLNAVEGTDHTDILPLLAIRHGRFFASASHGRFSSDFNVRSSPLILPSGQTLVTSRTDHFKRRESDLNLGYSLTPELGIALGYKDATESREASLGGAPQRTPLLTTKVRGYLLGAVGSFAVSEKLRIYGQAGYGPARLKLRFNDPLLGSTKANGRYLIGELGLSYPIYTNANGFGSTTAAVGYRTQTIKTDSYSSFVEENRDLRDVRDGMVLSLNVTL